jgi:superfamily II DNA/RNA helicase
LATEYFERLPFPPYPVQEEALLHWFTADQGVMVCAPTGTGKTMIAEAAVYEALRTGKQCYYTTPLIALTDQKLVELQRSAVRWGFPANQIGLVTGNRRVHPHAPVLVVVAEILLNRLLHRESFDFSQVASVVMDEFHSFNDPERGIVWELSLGLLPPAVRTLLLSATVGNSVEFCSWLGRAHQRKLELVQGTQRTVPLSFWWIDDAFLDEQMERMAEGDEVARRTPALLFCFNRDQCWQVADLLRGKKLIDKTRQAALAQRLEEYDLSEGAGPKLKAILQRGVGIHHAGILPKYRRIVEELFQAKLLSVTVCTETLSAGINLPARSVVLPTILKGPKEKRTLVEPSSAHQIFGRAGRPQYDREGFVFALAHEDDVKYLRWKQKYDQIPEDTKDPGLLQAKKQLKKKMPKRREGETYWSQQQFEQLRAAPAARLASRGPLPWRLLAYMLQQSPQVQPIRDLVGRRLLDAKQLEAGQRELNQRLVTLWTAGYLDLDPKPKPKSLATSSSGPSATNKKQTPDQIAKGLMESAGWKVVADQDDEDDDEAAALDRTAAFSEDTASRGFDVIDYRPVTATPTERMETLIRLRSIHPLYGVYVAGQLAHADSIERIQALESVLEIPGNVARLVPVPPPDVLPPGLLASNRLDHQLLELGLATQEELTGKWQDEPEDDPESLSSGRARRPRKMFEERPPRPLAFGDKLRRMFDHDFPSVHDLYTRSVWVVGELLEFQADFTQYIRARSLQKQEGIIFRHVLRFLLLAQEMADIPPEESTVETWEDPWDDLVAQLSDCCRHVDPDSTDEALENSTTAGDELLIGLPEKRRVQRPPVSPKIK